ncbi:MAG: YafY family protein [Planctomycetota bacterium]
MNLSRIRRLLKLIGVLQAGRGYNVDALAQACDVSRRTIFRDLDALRQSGVPLIFDEGQQRYHIPGTYFLPPTNFTPEEVLALIVLCHDLGDRAQLPFFGPARSAALKLASNLPDRFRELLRATGQAVTVKMPPTNPLDGQKPLYDQLLAAISGRQSVRICYRGPIDGEIRTRLHPYRLLFSRRSWYVIGRSSLHRSTRTFNVGRIRDLEMLEERYRIPRGFSVDRYLRNAWHMIPEPGPDRQVVVRFSRLVAQNVAEVRWHKTQTLHFNDDGTLDFHVTVSGLREISWWILSYGDQAEVLRPAELRQIVAECAARMVEKYAGAKG